MKALFVGSCIGFLLIGCASTAAPVATVLPASTQTTTPFAAPPFGQDIISSPTFSSETGSDEYCRPPYAVLSVSDGDDISEDEIVYELMEIWLKRYISPDAPPLCRIDGFTIDKVYFDLDILSRPLEPRGDFMRLVEFSVKLIQSSTDWMSFSGELDQEHWLHVRHSVSIFELPEGYTMQFAYP
jgi:hypothetical protein